MHGCALRKLCVLCEQVLQMLVGSILSPKVIIRGVSLVQLL